MKSKSTASQIPLWAPSTAIFLAAVIAILVVIPKTRTALKEVLYKNHRQVLSTARGSVFPDGSLAKVIKVKSGNEIIIEVYNIKSDSSVSLFQSISLGPFKDGHLVTKQSTTNLILEDANKDGALDILVPVFDNSLKAQLRVFTYQAQLAKFIEL